MEIIEFPKALYLHGEYKAVNDADEEKAHRADGWTDWAKDHKRTTADKAAPKRAEKEA